MGFLEDYYYHVFFTLSQNNEVTNFMIQTTDEIKEAIGFEIANDLTSGQQSEESENTDVEKRYSQSTNYLICMTISKRINEEKGIYRLHTDYKMTREHLQAKIDELVKKEELEEFLSKCKNEKEVEEVE